MAETGSSTNNSFLASTNIEAHDVRFVHSISEAGRLLPSASRWNSIELNFAPNFLSSNSFDITPSNYSKSIHFNLTITDKKRFYRFLYGTIFLIILVLALFLVLGYLPRRRSHQSHSKNVTLALNQALMFFDTQKSGVLPLNNPVKFRGDSGLSDGNSGDIHVDLIGGFYDSGSNVKFGFPTAYTITLLSWTVIEYHQKYEAIGELDHIQSIIRWGTEYLLKVFVPPNSTYSGLIYSQVGSISESTIQDNDINCWQRPEDMTYVRPVSFCENSGSDLAGETAAALAASSMVFKKEKSYSEKLIQVAEKLFEFAIKDRNQNIYTMDDACGEEARKYYNSSDYMDELAWGGTWLFFATGNTSYLRLATKNFELARASEPISDKGVFDWNNKLAATAVLLTRLRYVRDPGYPYEATLRPCSEMSELLMCSYLSQDSSFKMTPGGLILQRPDNNSPLQFAATAAFLSKLYGDYLDLMMRSGGSCSSASFSIEMLKNFSTSQVNYILGKNPLKMSYLVGFGDHFPMHVHHRSASTPWDKKHYTCAEGNQWLFSRAPNPNILFGAMVGGPNKEDQFLDDRDRAEYTEPTISSNAGLVAALIAVFDPPNLSFRSSKQEMSRGMDQMGIFTNLHSDSFANATKIIGNT